MTQEACAILTLLHTLDVARDEQVVDLIGRRYGRSRRREEIVRLVTRRFCDGKIDRLTDYMKSKSLLEWGSESSLRSDIATLIEAGVIHLVRGEEDRRVVWVWPTKKTIDFYNRKLPVLAIASAEAVKPLMGRLKL